MTTEAPFPFTAVVGQDEAKLALMLAAVEPRLGGVLLRGQKGSAKTTLARGLAALLAGRAPFVELPVGATEDRLVGSIDLAAALTGGEVRFAPGLLAAAHGGVLYVDEVNLLADHLVDVLLDVAVTGVNRVEREGISHAHPSRFVLIGSMNPEEGELRPQLLDRFGLAADVLAGTEPADRAEAVRRRLAFDADPEPFLARWHDAEASLAARLAAAVAAPVPDDLLDRICALCASVGAEGLRADLAVTRAAAALAGIDGRDRATFEDVRSVAGLALAHRRRRHPFDAPGSGDELQAALDATAPEEPDAAEEDGDPPDGSGDLAAGTEEPPGATEGPPGGSEDAGGGSLDEGDGREPDRAGRDRLAPPAAPWTVARVEGPRTTSGPDGRRSMVSGTRGRLIGHRRPEDRMLPGGVAVAATVRAAATRQASLPDPDASAGTEPPPVPGTPQIAPSLVRGTPHTEPPLVRVTPHDVREGVREQRAANLVVLVVDASGSMGAQRRMEAAKGALLGLLLDAYQRRDRVALVTFRGQDAEVVLRPTGSVEVASARLADLATGGRTPLAAGIEAATKLAGESARAGAYRPLLVLVTDGRATSAPAGADPLEAARAAASASARMGLAAVVADAEEGFPRLGLAAELAVLMGAPCMALADLSASTLRSLATTPAAHR